MLAVAEDMLVESIVEDIPGDALASVADDIIESLTDPIAAAADDIMLAAVPVAEDIPADPVAVPAVTRADDDDIILEAELIVEAGA